MKGSLKRSSDAHPQQSEGSKRRKPSRSSSEQAAVRRARSSSKDATQATADAASDGGLSGELGQLFRDEDVSQLASDFPLPGAAPEGGGAKTNQPDAHGGALPGRQRGMGVLSEEELLEQRGEALSQLYKLYKKEYWALAEELRTRHQQFCAAGGTALMTSGPTAMAADSDEELSVRALYRRARPQKSDLPQKSDAAAAPADRRAARVSGAAAGGRAAGAPASAGNSVASAATNVNVTEPIPMDADAAGAAEQDDARSEASDEECPPVSDVEDVTLAQDPYGPARDTSALLRGYGDFRSNLQLIGRLEECAAAADGREMDGSSALAKLVGSQAQFLIHRTSVILGRATAEAPTVDVDLATEGDARKVSRRAASITLHHDGAFRLRCLGRRSVYVNGREVPQGQAARLPHLSLLEAGRVRLLFCVNAGAVRRILRRSRAVTIRQDA